MIELMNWKRLCSGSHSGPKPIRWIFSPEPDWKAARKLLEAGGISLDSISAHCMRHVVEGVGKIAREAAYSLAVLLLSGRADGTARVARSRGVYAAAQNRSYVRLRLCVTTRSLLG